MTRPICPRDIAGSRTRVLPDAVIEAWNHLIAFNYREDGTGVSTITRSEAVAQLSRLLPHLPEESRARAVHDLGWMDIEPMYRARGWDVQYRPYISTYQCSVFEFRSWVSKWER